MKPAQVAAGDFKARCLKLIDEVAASGGELTITKRGKPVAMLVPVRRPKGLFGALGGSVLVQHRLVDPVDDDWEAAR